MLKDHRLDNRNVAAGGHSAEGACTGGDDALFHLFGRNAGTGATLPAAWGVGHAPPGGRRPAPWAAAAPPALVCARLFKRDGPLPHARPYQVSDP